MFGLRRTLMRGGLLCRCCRYSTYVSEPVAVEPDNAEVQALLLNLAGLDLHKVMARRKEPLLIPHYKLMTLEQLQEAQAEAVNRAKSMLQPPPILPQRAASGEVIQVDEKLAGAIDHRMIFTETSQHKDNQLRSIVVREPDGVLRQATWEERDRMCQVFFPTLGRKMWLPKALSDEVLPSTLDSMLHIKILDLVCVQCDPQSQDYHRVHKHVYEDIERRGCYDLLRSTRYFGGLVWHLLTSSHPPRVYGLLKDMLQRNLLANAVDLIQLFTLCFPESEVSMKLKDLPATSSKSVEVFCELCGFEDLLSFIDKETYQVQRSTSGHAQCAVTTHNIKIAEETMMEKDSGAKVDTAKSYEPRSMRKELRKIQYLCKTLDKLEDILHQESTQALLLTVEMATLLDPVTSEKLRETSETCRKCSERLAQQHKSLDSEHQEV